MNITNITEGGSNNILLWAIKNNASILNDHSLQSIVNDELYYTVTLTDVNLFELFRLTQIYREKLHIISEEQAELPSDDKLSLLFPGEYVPDNKAPDKTVKLHKMVQETIQSFINLTLQMSSDLDIVNKSIIPLFIPMISYKFSIQIPISFIDFISSLNKDEIDKIYNDEYPNTLYPNIIATEINSFKTSLQLVLIKSTSIIKYNKQYEQYIKLTKYAPLNTVKNNNELFKFALLDFFKYDPINRNEVKCNLQFTNYSTTFRKNLQLLEQIPSPLKVSFIVELPIQYMQLLENSFSREQLEIKYESSMADIIDSTKFLYNDFISYTYDVESINEENKIKTITHHNAISEYKTRISECHQMLTNMIKILLSSNTDIDISSTFAMIPSLYKTKAVITINTSYKDEYLKINNADIYNMLEQMLYMANLIFNKTENPE